MDIERNRRMELIDGLKSEFICFEEVKLQHALFKRRTLRADVVGIPKDNRLSQFAFAFEVKIADKIPYAEWSQIIRQASDYNYATITKDSNAKEYAGRRVSATFIYPCPPYDPAGVRDPGPHLRDGDNVMATGIFHLALHFRVGRAGFDASRHKGNFELTFGPNPVWSNGRGYWQQGINLVSGTRTIGSQRFNVASELDGA